MPVEDGQWDDDAPDLGPMPDPVFAEDDPDPGEGKADEAPPLPEFDPKFRQDFEGLMYLGRLTDTFEWLGHSFTIRTLTAGEILEVGLLHKQYAGTLADVKAYQAAVVAACVVYVDDQPMPLPITTDPADTALLNKFRYVLKRWYPPILDVIYERYLLLEARVQEVLVAMGKAPASTASTLT